MRKLIGVMMVFVLCAWFLSISLYAGGTKETKKAETKATETTAPKQLRYATIAEPPSLDQQVITSDQATTIAQHVFEGLYTFNSKYDPVPLLVESEAISQDGAVSPTVKTILKKK